MKVVRGISYVISMLSGLMALWLAVAFVMLGISGDTGYGPYLTAVLCVVFGANASCLSAAASILPAFSRIPFIKVTSIINLVIQLLLLINLAIDFLT